MAYRFKFRWIIGIILIMTVVEIQAGEAQQTIRNENPLYVDPSTQDFSRNLPLLERIQESPHGYFRFINIIFSNEVCRRFSYLLLGPLSLNLHGDAHLEQYAITDLGRGLTDFDDSSIGPGILDLMRFSVSCHLACRERGWIDSSDVIFDKFIDGYRDALKDPNLEFPEPLVARRIRSTFTYDREKYFQWVESIMNPIPAAEADSLFQAYQPYVEMKLIENPDLNKNYFNIVQCGYLRMGIGSALDLKYLLRVQGETDDPMDDVVLEVKEVRDLSGIECINPGRKNDPFRILLGQAWIAYQPFHHLGYFRFRGLTFWVHSWVDNYKEVSIEESFKSARELAEVAYDVGVQLGKGHIKHISAPLDLQIRQEELQLIKNHAEEMKNVREELANDVIQAWERFRQSVVNAN